MKVVRTGVLLVLIVSGFFLSAPSSQANPAFYSGFAYSHPGYSYYYPWAASFGFGYPTYYFPPYMYGPNAYAPPPQPYYYGYPAGEVRAEVKPGDAKVFVDGHYVGQVKSFDSWYQRLRLVPGMHRVTFRAPGFQPYVTDLQIQPGSDYHIKYEMQPGQDSINENDMRLPNDNRNDQYDQGRQGDRFYRDHDRGPDQYGTHDQNRDPYDNPDNGDYPDNDDDRGQDNRAAHGNNQTMYIHVEPSDATVYIDGNYFGTADAHGSEDLKVLLPAGKHRVEVVRPGYKSYSQDVELGGNSTNNLSVTLEPK